MRSLLLLPLIFVAVGCANEESLKVPTTTSAAWKKDVLDNPGPVLIDFTARWCGPCRQMNPTIASLARDFTVYKVDYDANPELVREYRIDGIPALLIFVGGVEVGRHVGITSEAVLRKKLNQLAHK